jgi:protein TonB
MSPQHKATHFSLLLHVMFVLCALTFGRHAIPEKMPLSLNFSICQAGPATAPGPPTVGASQPVTNQAKKIEPAAAKEKTVLVKRVVKKKITPVKQVTKIAKKPAPPPPQKTKLAEEVPQIVQNKAPIPENPTPTVADSRPADSGATSAATTVSSMKGTAEPRPQIGGGREGLFLSKQLDGTLVVLKQTRPPYPRRARRLNIEGWIKVNYIVDEHGHVGHVTILDAKPEGVFEQSVLQCVSEWRFKPGTMSGLVVKALVEQTITFKLES